MGLGDEVRLYLWYDSAKIERRRRMEFSEKLQLLRKQRGWTQEQLAERIYVSRTAVSKWESEDE